VEDSEESLEEIFIEEEDKIKMVELDESHESSIAYVPHESHENILAGIENRRTYPLTKDAIIYEPEFEIEEKPKRSKIKKELETTIKIPLTEINFLRGIENRHGFRLIESGKIMARCKLYRSNEYNEVNDFSDVFCPCEVVVRAYILKGISLVPKDPNGFCNTWLNVKYGNSYTSNKKDNRFKDSLSPAYFTLFEFKAVLPSEDNNLYISVYDNVGSGNELLGYTSIDLCNRWFSDEWRGLEEKPIEFRKLYNPNAKTSQGQLEMWLEMMTPEDAMKLSPEKLIPPSTQKWYIRTVVYSVTNLHVRNGISLFVSGKLANDQKAQVTDIHNNIENNIGCFNWRFVWEFFLPTKQETRVILQVWDRDYIRPDAALAECSVNITNLLKASHHKNEVITIGRQWVNLNLPDREGLQGKIEIEIEIVPEAQALEHPKGKGRDSLPPPVRPRPPWSFSTSFSNNKKCITLVFVVIVVIIFCYFVYQLLNQDGPPPNPTTSIPATTATTM